ncbi:hypothetical protein ABE473_12705 [Stenotrophomonas sp. TWI700]
MTSNPNAKVPLAQRDDGRVQPRFVPMPTPLPEVQALFAQSN